MEIKIEVSKEELEKVKLYMDFFERFENDDPSEFLREAFEHHLTTVSLAYCNAYQPFIRIGS